MKRLELKQGSPEWHEVRSRSIGASDAVIIMGDSPWNTPSNLLKEKWGLIVKESNTAMERGKELEKEGMDAFLKLGYVKQELFPDVYQHDEYTWMIASFDGISKDRKDAVEIKCPTPKNYHEYYHGIGCYMAQLQHQCFVANLPGVWFCVYCPGEKPIVHYIKRNDAYIRDLIEREKIFYDHLINKTEWVDPKYIRRNDTVLEDLVKQYTIEKQALEQAQKNLDETKALIIQACQDKPTYCKGMFIEKKVRLGSINYDEIDVLQSMDLEPYRKKSIEYWTIR